MFRRLFPFLAVTFLICIDTSVLPQFLSGDICPLLAYTSIAAFGLILGPLRGAALGFWAGLIFDATCSPVFGRMILLYAICGGISGFAGRYMKRSPLTSTITSIVMLIVYEITLLLIIFINGTEITAGFMVACGIRILINAAITQIWYLLFGLVCREKQLRYESR